MMFFVQIQAPTLFGSFGWSVNTWKVFFFLVVNSKITRNRNWKENFVQSRCYVSSDQEFTTNLKNYISDDFFSN